MKKNFKNITIIGKSSKFIKIISSLFYKSYIQEYPWRSIVNLKLTNEMIKKKPDLIFICGYDYQSHWYSYKKYYYSNITAPFKLVEFLKKKTTLIIYIDTTNKIKKQIQIDKKYTFSRYEFAKKELGYKLFKKYDNLRILNVPLIKDSKNKVKIFGSNFMSTLFNILLSLNLINSIKISQLKKLIFISIKNKKKIKPIKLKSFGLSIPRSLFLDRLLRFIHD